MTYQVSQRDKKQWVEVSKHDDYSDAYETLWKISKKIIGEFKITDGKGFEEKFSTKNKQLKEM